MKAFTAVVTLIVLLSACFSPCYAEDFQLRNSILFGDDIKTIKGKETLSFDSQYENIIWYKGTVAGLDNTSVRYEFDETNGGLVDMQYAFQSNSSKSISDANYKTVHDSLIRQYGQPLSYEHTIYSSVIAHYVAQLMPAQEKGGGASLTDWIGWVVDCDGYSVKIDLIKYAVKRNKSSAIEYAFDVGYKYFTQKDIDEKTEKKQQENSEVDGDL